MALLPKLVVSTTIITSLSTSPFRILSITPLCLCVRCLTLNTSFACSIWANQLHRTTVAVKMSSPSQMSIISNLEALFGLEESEDPQQFWHAMQQSGAANKRLSQSSLSSSSSSSSQSLSFTPSKLRSSKLSVPARSSSRSTRPCKVLCSPNAF